MLLCMCGTILCSGNACQRTGVPVRGSIALCTDTQSTPCLLPEKGQPAVSPNRVLAYCYQYQVV